MNPADANRQQSDIDIDGFSIYWMLKKIDMVDAEEVGRIAQPLFESHPHWRTIPPHERMSEGPLQAANRRQGQECHRRGRVLAVDAERAGAWIRFR
jgi:hypothetical protein